MSLKKFNELLTKEINSFVEICLKTLGEKIKAIILFGSVGRGKSHPDEDLDFCIIVREYPQPDYKFGAKIMELCDEIGLTHPIDPVFVTEEGLKDFSSPFTLEVITDGVLVYGNYPLKELRDLIISQKIKPIYEEESRIGWELSS
ncbi:MAG: nucleotidyltransferase domain-containing protein [bacterium]